MRRATFSLDTLLEAYIREAPRTIRDLRGFVADRSVESVPRIERALQRLRRKKLVHLVGRLWAHPSVQACRSCAGHGWAVGGTQPGAICTVCEGAGWIKSETAEDPVNDDESK